MPTNNEAIELPTETATDTKPTRAEASRINGAKSHGPVTDEGKAASSQNALRHGEYAKNLTLKFENQEGFISTLAALEEEFKPQTDLEADLILTMAQARWRTIRIWSIEKGVLDQAIETAVANRPAQPEAAETPLLPVFSAAHKQLSDESSVLRMIDRSETRYQRIFSRALKELLMIRADRRAESAAQAAREPKNKIPAAGDHPGIFKNPVAFKNAVTNPGKPFKSMFPVGADYPGSTAPPPRLQLNPENHPIGDAGSGSDHAQ